MAFRCSFTPNTHELPPGGFEWQSSWPWHDWHQVGSPTVATNCCPLAVWNPGNRHEECHSDPSQCSYFGKTYGPHFTAINALSIFISFILYLPRYILPLLATSCHTANCNCLAAWCDEQKCSKHRRIWPRPEWKSFVRYITPKNIKLVMMNDSEWLMVVACYYIFWWNGTLCGLPKGLVRNSSLIPDFSNRWARFHVL